MRHCLRHRPVSGRKPHQWMRFRPCFALPRIGRRGSDLVSHCYAFRGLTRGRRERSSRVLVIVCNFKSRTGWQLRSFFLLVISCKFMSPKSWSFMYFAEVFSCKDICREMPRRYLFVRCLPGNTWRVFACIL